jgi:hypothetical protein
MVRAMSIMYVRSVSASDTLNPHELPFTGMLDRHLRSASGRGRCSFDDDSGQRGAIFRYTRRCGRRGDHGAVRFVSLVMEMFLPGTLQAALGKWIPFNAGSQIWSTVSVPQRPPVLTLGRVRGVHRLRGGRSPGRAGALPAARRLTIRPVPSREQELVCLRRTR